MTDVHSILQVASKLSVEEMRQLNVGLVQMLRQRYRSKAAQAATAFVPGQLVSWVTKKRGGGTKYMRIEKFNRAGTCVVGLETDSNGKPPAGTAFPNRWTVGTDLITAVK